MVPESLTSVFTPPPERDGQAYVEEFGIDPAVFAEISIKARKHAANNPNAMSPTAR
jgi:hypothetical protein